MKELNLTPADIYAIIEAFGALKDSGTTPKTKILLNEEIVFLKKLKQYVEDNGIFTANKWLLDSLVK